MTDDMFFECPVVRLRIHEHPEADRLELASMEGTRLICVVPKGQFSDGDTAVFFPEDAIVPDDVLEDMGLVGMLSGKDKNRVKMRTMRGKPSHGLLYDPAAYGKIKREVGFDMKDIIGVEKHVPPVPVQMAGQVTPGPTLKYEIAQWHRYPDAIEDGTPVVMTEKLHGTWCCLGWSLQSHDGLTVVGRVVSSKGHSKNGLMFTDDVDNIYTRAWSDYGERIMEYAYGREASVYFLGEVYGPKVQSMGYGLQQPAFALFDIYVGHPGQGSYLAFEEMVDVASELGIPRVPEVYEGPYDESVLMKHTNSPSVVYDGYKEGVVVKPLVEARHYDIGRLVLKNVSDAYIADQKGGKRG